MRPYLLLVLTTASFFMDCPASALVHEDLGQQRQGAAGCGHCAVLTGSELTGWRLDGAVHACPREIWARR